MIERARAKMGATAGIVAAAGSHELVDIGFVFTTTCYDKDGNVIWEDVSHNTVTTAGKNDMLTQYFKAIGYTATWYVGLKDTGTVVVGDTMASHGGWVEDVTYSNATRPALVLGTASAGSVGNSASRAAFNINGTTTIYGCFLCNNSTVGGGSGTLYSGVDFTTGARAVLSGDTLSVQLTLSLT